LKAAVRAVTNYNAEGIPKVR